MRELKSASLSEPVTIPGKALGSELRDGVNGVKLFWENGELLVVANDYVIGVGAQFIRYVVYRDPWEVAEPAPSRVRALAEYFEPIEEPAAAPAPANKKPK